jgi:hypothetical protein
MNALLAQLASAVTCPPHLARGALQAHALVMPAGFHRLTRYGRKTEPVGPKP